MLKQKIKNLIALIEGTEINEIEVSSFWGGQKIRLSKSDKNKQKNTDTVYIHEADKTIENEEPIEKRAESTIVEDTIKGEIIDNPIQESSQNINLYKIKAPLVGTYYSSPKPSDPAFINIGDKINKGDTICIIEAMKIFNEIESDVSGIVKEICVDNGNPVEFDQVIVKISVD